MATAGVPQRSTPKEETGSATQIADCFTKSMKPTHMLRVLDTCKHQISREGYAKPSASSEVAAPVGQPKLESARTEQ